MIGWGRWLGWSWAGFAFAALAFSVSPAQAANTYGDVCAGCHSNTFGPPASPPFMPSQNLPFGLIMKEQGQFTDSCTAPANPPNCVLRTLLANDPGMASATMTFTNAELEAVRVYLLQVRDLGVANPSPAFSFPSTLTTSSSSSTSSIAIANWRGASVGYQLSLSGTNAGDFSITSATSGSCAVSSTWLAATPCPVPVTVLFAPTAGGSRAATLNVAFTAGAGDPVPFTRTFSLSGTGVVPTPGFSISSTTLNLSAKLGSSAPGSLTITNPGSATANLVLGTLVYSTPQYVRAASSTCDTNTSLAPAGSCVLTTTFTPTAAGTQNGTLTISHNAPGSPATVTLNGTGTQSLISPTTSTLPFTNVQLGVPKVLNLTVTNTGTANLVFAVEPSDPSARTGPASSDYAVGGTCHVASPLVPAGTCSLVVTFTPAALGARLATLTVTSDATNGPLTVALGGTGVALPEPVVTFPGSNFPDTVIGQTATATRTITIENDRTRDITYSISSIPDFTIGTESCAGRVVTGGGGTCTIAVQFVPTLGAGEGLRQGTLPITFAGTGGDVNPSSMSGVVAGVALLPLGQSASTLNASAVVGSPTTLSLLLTNRSASSLTLSGLVFGGATPSDYALDPSNTCSTGLVLAASGNCTLVIRFAPAAAGTRNAVLSITHTAVGSPQTVTLLGTATPAPQGLIQLSATSISFTDTQLGSTSTQGVTVVNGGNLALNFSAFKISGAAATEYTQSGTCSTLTALAIGGQCMLTVTFGPTSLGLRNATLTITSDASNGAATLPLSGNGVPVPAPQVTLAPTTLDFGTQTTGGIYPARLVRLTNSGTADLAIGSVVVAGAGFSNSSPTPCPAVLVPAAECDIAVSLLATSATAYAGTLTVSSNAAGSPSVVTLSGSGTASALPVLVWSPAVANLDFGQVAAGSISAVQTVTLSNQGPGGVNLTVLNAIGPDGAAFSVVGGTCSFGTPLFQGQTCTVNVSFAPGSAGSKTALVQVASTGSFPPALTLTGVGLAGPNPSLALSASSLAFAAIPVGAQSPPQDVRLTSAGSGVVTVTALSMTGPYAIQSTTCPAPPFTLPAGSQCTVSVSFRPVAEGTAAGTLQVVADAAVQVPDLILSGAGLANPSLSSGGCMIGPDGSLLDPMLWLMLTFAALALLRRTPRASAVADGDDIAFSHPRDQEESAK
jgi:trimeric autotransporter adhesin